MQVQSASQLHASKYVPFTLQLLICSLQFEIKKYIQESKNSCLMVREMWIV